MVSYLLYIYVMNSISVKIPPIPDSYCVVPDAPQVYLSRRVTFNLYLTRQFSYLFIVCLVATEISTYQKKTVKYTCTSFGTDMTGKTE